MDQRSRQKVEKFFSRFQKLHFAKHAILLRPGQTPLGIFYLKKGLVRQYILSKKGEVMVVHIFRSGAFFLMSWAVNQTPNHYYFEAITPVEVFKAPLKEVNKFIKTEPALLYNLTSRIMKGLDGLVKRLAYLTFDPAYVKVASLLAYFAKSFGKKNGQGISIEFPLTHREIAAWIGTARETTSLQIEELKRKNLIDLSGRSIVVKDLKKLEKETLVADLP